VVTRPPIVTPVGPGKVPPTTSVPVTQPPIQHIDPSLIWGLRPPSQGVPRNEIKVPICPSSNVMDEVLFEDPAQPAKKYYLPRYELAMTSDGGAYHVALRQDSSKSGSPWALGVLLKKSAAPSLAAAANSAQELQHRVTVILRYNQMMGNQAGGREELVFNNVNTEANGQVAAKFYFASMQQRDAIYHALTDQALGATLVVRRAITVAVPASPVFPLAMGVAAGIMRRPPMPMPPRPQPQGALFQQVERALDQEIAPKPFVFPAGYFQDITPATVPTKNVELTKFEVTGPDNQSHHYYRDGARPYVFYYTPDTFKIARRPDGSHEPLLSIRFGDPAPAADLKVTFSFVAAPYVDPARLADAAEKLKDSMGNGLPKGIDTPQFEPLSTPPEKTRFQLSYPGSDTSHGPFELRDKASVDLRSGIRDSLTLSLAQFQSLYDALFDPSSLLLTGTVNVQLGNDSMDIPFSGRAYDLAGDLLAYGEQQLGGDGSDAPQNADSDGTSLTDTVVDAIGDATSGKTTEAVTEVVGALAKKFLKDRKKKKDKKDKDKKNKKEKAPVQIGVQATLQNVTESPVEIQSLQATLIRGQERLAANIEGLDLSQPLQLAPGDQVALTVVPADEIKPGGVLHVEYDLSGVHAAPDKETIWNAILDPSGAQNYLMSITVKTPASTFSIPAGHAAQRVVSLVVDFDSGVSVELNANKLEAKVDLPQPVTDLVLHKENSGTYRYKVNVVRANGEQSRDADWRPPETTTILFPALQA
jgi:hypothetical protein